jgi:WD40 repeat protein
MAVTLQDDYIVTGDNDRLVKLFSASSTELLRTFEGHTDLVRTVSVNVVDGLLVSGGYDRTIRVGRIVPTARVEISLLLE